MGQVGIVSVTGWRQRLARGLRRSLEPGLVDLELAFGAIEIGCVEDHARMLHPVGLADLLGAFDDVAQTRDEAGIFSSPEQCTHGASPLETA